MLRPIPIGIDDFQKLRERGHEYVDKSLLIREVLDKGAEVILFPRPRRFGKTLNLSMLRYFFEKRAEDSTPLFADLAIASAGPAYQAHFQRYPVIFLTFKGVKTDSFEAAWNAIRGIIRELYREHASVLDGDRLDEWQIADFRAVLDGTASWALYETALLTLSSVLSSQYGERVIILIDEYDQPIHSAWVHGYSAKMLEFCRNFLTAGLKGNPYLFKAVLTGILRIAKESIFSGLNNPDVYSLLRTEFSTAFGFTEPEVESLLARAGRQDQGQVVRDWYNGYVFGGNVIYNPWSILKYLDRVELEPQPFWVSTSSNDLVRENLIYHARDIQEDLETLLAGGGVERRLDEEVVLTDLATRVDALYGLLTFSGYLKAEKVIPAPGEEAHYRLSIPNREVRQVYSSTFKNWMLDRLGGSSRVDRLKRSLLGGDADSVQEELQCFTESVLSYHDTALRPEQVYHAFVIGLLASLEPEYEVRSNRESGGGRPDVSIRPKRPGVPGILLELKVARPGRTTPEQALAEALSQIQTQNYTAELRASGANPIVCFAVAFDGKRVWVQRAE